MMNNEKEKDAIDTSKLDEILPKYDPLKLNSINLAQNYVSAFNTGMNIYQCVNQLQGYIEWVVKAVNDVVKSWNVQVGESIDQSKAIVRETTTEQFNVEWTNKQPELIEQVNTLTTNQFNEDWGVLENRINTTLETQNTNIQNIQNEQNELENNTNNNINAQNTKINTIQTQQTNLANEQNTLSNRMDTFTSLSSGSTTGDAELQDIRVGANGVTYPNAGDAVRGQYSQLKEDLNQKISKPTTANDNKVPRAKNGDVEWVEVGQPTDTQTSTAVNNWLNAHPEATTTVKDGSLGENKFTDELKKKTVKDYVTPQIFGAVGDGVHDDTNAFREAIRSGLPVYVPNGKYIITDTIYIPKGTTIYGVDNKSEWFKNANIEPDNGTIIKFNPPTMKSLFVLEDSELEVGYCPNVSISNLTIVGCSKADVCINFRNACHSNISNVSMTDFKVGLSISYNMLNTFTNVQIQKCSSFNILINGEMSTTCNFYDCYIGQNTDSNSIGMFIDEYCGYGLSFYSLTVETLQNGIKISDRNEVSFHGIYSENTPNTAEAGYMMRVGSHGNDTAPSIVSLYGGTIQGNNAYNIDSHYAIEIIGKNTHVNVYGVKFLIFEKILKLLDDKASASFYDCIEISTTYNIETVYNANPSQISYTNCDSVIVPVKNRNRYKLNYVAFESTTWTAYQSGCYATNDNYFYIVRISATANGNIVGKLPFKPACEVYTKLLDLSLGDTFIDCYVDSNGNIMAKGQTDGHVYKGQIIIHSSNIIK